MSQANRDKATAAVNNACEMNTSGTMVDSGAAQSMVLLLASHIMPNVGATLVPKCLFPSNFDLLLRNATRDISPHRDTLQRQADVAYTGFGLTTITCTLDQ